MRKLAGSLAVPLALALAAPFAVGLAPTAVAQEAPATDRLFSAPLSGANENPPVTTAASGNSTLRYDAADDELDVLVTTQGLEAITMAHIHLGAPGANGPVVASLFGTVPGGVTRDGTLSFVSLDDDRVSANLEREFDGTVASLVEELAAGNAYVNVHTVANPGGELRGNVEELPDAPAFTDTDRPEVLAIAAAGVTQGTTATTFSPERGLTRAEMAVLLDRALVLPATTTDFFDDDEGTFAEDQINRVAAAAITLGVGPRAFDPAGPVTRGQFASFLARGLALTEGAGLGLFADGGATHSDDVDALTVAGIALGTGPDTFGTDVPVNRDQTAIFLARALGLVDRPVPVASTLTVLHNNDGESRVLPDGDEAGAAQFVAAVDALRAEAEAETDGSILVSSGDNILPGQTFAASRENEVFYDALVLERLDYDAIALGNHDFDFGPEVLAEFINAFTEAPQYLSANIDASAVPSLQELVDAGTVAPSTLVDVAGGQVGIVSAITPDLAAISSPGDVVVDQEIRAVVQAEIDSLIEDGADTVVLISHLQGIPQELALIPQLSGIDIVVAGGGSELLADEGAELLPSEDPAGVFGPYPLEAINRDGATVPVVTTSGGYGYVGQLFAQLGPAGNFVAEGDGSGLVPVVGFTPDAEIVETVEEPVAAFVAELQTQVVAQSEVALDGLTNSVRSFETNLGNLIADAYVDQVAALAPEITDPIVGLQNGGGIRNNSVLESGPFNRQETFSVLPFGNLLAVTEDVSPTQLLAVLNHSVANTPPTGANAGGQFGQFSGLSFTYDPSLPVGSKVLSVTLDDGTDLVVAGVPVVGATDVALALLNFTARGGDNYPLGDGVGLPFRALGISDIQAFENYLTGTLEGVITAADYPEGGEGRINVVGSIG